MNTKLIVIKWLKIIIGTLAVVWVAVKERLSQTDHMVILGIIIAGFLFKHFERN